MSRLLRNRGTRIVLPLAFVVVLVVGGAAYWLSYRIEDEIGSGSGYGLVIGESGIDVARKIRSDLGQTEWPVAICSTGDSRYTSFDTARLTDSDLSGCNYVYLTRRQRDLATDGLRLEFEGGTLVAIYRYRKPFELP